jgi:hypothetical protein
MRDHLITMALLTGMVALWGCAAGYSNERMEIYDRAAAVETLINNNPCLAGDTAFCNHGGV